MSGTATSTPPYVFSNSNPVTNVDYAFTINHPTMCLANAKLFLLIMVFSAPAHFKARLTIRQTWGSIAERRDISLAFILGNVADNKTQQQIVAEDLMFEDIIQADFRDHYKNLSVKSVVMLKWTKTYCGNAQFLLKVDDDVFLHPDNLLRYLKGPTSERGSVIYGNVLRDHRPNRDEKSKWYVSTDEYPQSLYPDFATGPSYVYTKNAVLDVHAATFNMPFMGLEDVFLNGLCAERANVTRIHNPNFCVPFGGYKPVDRCSNGGLVTFHEVSSNVMHLLWWAITDSRSQHCPKQMKRRNTIEVDKLLRIKDLN